MTKPILYDHPGSICSQMARLALAEKGVDYKARNVDIMQSAEQFEPWYVALNPKAVVPTLVHGEMVVTDTKNIVRYVDAEFPGPALTPKDADGMNGWLDQIMGLHYGVLLYSRKLDERGVAPTIVERGKLLQKLLAERSDMAGLLEGRIAGNARFLEILSDEAAVRVHIDSAKNLVLEMAATLDTREFLTGASYSLADCFATAALARFRLHGFGKWWASNSVAEYYDRMKDRPSFAGAGVLDSGDENDL